MDYNENKCKGIAGSLFGHKFEAVFDTESNTTANHELFTAIAPALEKGYDKLIEYGYTSIGNPFEEVLSELKYRKSTYVHHVCVRCGKTVKKD